MASIGMLRLSAALVKARRVVGSKDKRRQQVGKWTMPEEYVRFALTHYRDGQVCAAFTVNIVESFEAYCL
jgi:hypothetical protein